jgi:hypothetical protein
MEAAGRNEGGVALARDLIKEFVDDYCGSGPPRFLMPPPWPRFDLKPNALDLIVAAAQFHSAAALSDHPLQEVFSVASDQLLKAGLAKIDRPER